MHDDRNSMCKVQVCPSTSGRKPTFVHLKSVYRMYSRKDAYALYVVPQNESPRVRYVSMKMGCQWLLYVGEVGGKSSRDMNVSREGNHLLQFAYLLFQEASQDCQHEKHQTN